MTAALIYKLIIALILIDFFIQQGLNYLNKKQFHFQAPPILKDIYNPKEYHKNQNYLSENHRFSQLHSLFSIFIILLLLHFQFFARFDEFLRSYINNPIWLSILYILTLGLSADLINTPFSYYDTFVIEQKYDFNKTSHKIFWTDKLKSCLLSLILGMLILYPIIYFFNEFPHQFWLYTWILISAFSLFMAMFYSNIIVPLFNKQTPLEEGELRKAIEQFSSKVGFRLTNIYVIDGSKRSTKANAYFTGLGKQKRIVLYDTLIDSMNTQEIVAVLAHEIGHYKHKHIISSLIISILNIGIMLWLFSLFANHPIFSQALGVAQPNIHIAAISFAILYSPISSIIGFFINKLSRKNEYQADTFAKENFEPEYLVSALKKLAKKSLSNLNPHPLYVAVNYSHPTLYQRITNLIGKTK